MVERDLRLIDIGIPIFHIGRYEPDASAARLKAASREVRDLARELEGIGRKHNYTDLGARVRKSGEIVIEVALHREDGSGAFMIEVNDEGLEKEPQLPGVVYRWETTDQDGNPLSGDVFYKASQEDRRPLVRNKQKVAPGQVVLWGLANKQDTPISARDEGEINILIKDGQHVKHGDPLFYIKPTRTEKDETTTS